MQKQLCNHQQSTEYNVSDGATYFMTYGLHKDKWIRLAHLYSTMSDNFNFPCRSHICCCLCICDHCLFFCYYLSVWCKFLSPLVLTLLVTVLKIDHWLCAAQFEKSSYTLCLKFYNLVWQIFVVLLRINQDILLRQVPSSVSLLAHTFPKRVHGVVTVDVGFQVKYWNMDVCGWVLAFECLTLCFWSQPGSDRTY